MPSPRFHDWWKQFGATGDICPVKLGMTRAELRELLGDPDDTGATSGGRSTPHIWKYGDLEFHFGPGPTDPLFLIFMDTDTGIVQVSIPRLTGGR